MVNSRQDTSFWCEKFNGGFNHQEQASHIPRNSEIGAESVVEIGEWDSDINVSNYSSYSSMAHKSSRGSYEVQTQKFLGEICSSGTDYETLMESSSSYGVEEDQLPEPNTTLSENEFNNGKQDSDNMDESLSSDEEFTLMLMGKQHSTLNSKSSDSLQVWDEYSSEDIFDLREYTSLKFPSRLFS